MANLLNKLRIDFASLTMLEGVTDKPTQVTIDSHLNILNGFLRAEGNSADDCFVSHEEYARLQTKTYRQLRLREMLLEHSKKASLVIMSLPMPRKVFKI